MFLSVRSSIVSPVASIRWRGGGPPAPMGQMGIMVSFLLVLHRQEGDGFIWLHSGLSKMLLTTGETSGFFHSDVLLLQGILWRHGQMYVTMRCLHDHVNVNWILKRRRPFQMCLFLAENNSVFLLKHSHSAWTPNVWLHIAGVLHQPFWILEMSCVFCLVLVPILTLVVLLPCSVSPGLVGSVNALWSVSSWGQMVAHY